MALSLGGVTHAALLTNLFDGVGFFAAAIFSFIAMELGSVGRWQPVLALLTSCHVVAAVSMLIGMRIDAEDKS